MCSCLLHPETLLCHKWCLLVSFLSHHFPVMACPLSTSKNALRLSTKGSVGSQIERLTDGGLLKAGLFS